jgi:hypothetical protein
MAVNNGELTRELEELIAALDRRVPRVEQVGEAAIARDAAALRAKAADRLEELVRDPGARPEPESGEPT